MIAVSWFKGRLYNFLFSSYILVESKASYALLDCCMLIAPFSSVFSGDANNHPCKCDVTVGLCNSTQLCKQTHYSGAVLNKIKNQHAHTVNMQ